MAYAKKNTVDYFPHHVNHGRKMFIIRSKYGKDGYVVWFMLLEELGKADNHLLDLNDSTQLMYLVSSFDVPRSVFLDVIETLVDLGELDRTLWEGAKVIYNAKFVESIMDAYKRRRSKPLKYEQICMQYSLKCMQKAENCIHNADTFQQSRVEDSRLDDIKVDETSDIFYDIADMKSHYLNHDRLKKAFCERQKISEDRLKTALNDFNLELSGKSKFQTTWKDYTSHFLSWFRKSPTTSAGTGSSQTIKTKMTKHD